MSDEVTGIAAIARSVRQGVSVDHDAFKPPFKAVVISKEFSISGGNVFSDAPIIRNLTRFFDKGGGATAFFGRIQGDPSLHDWLDDPCDPATSDNPVEAKALVVQHTLFIDQRALSSHSVGDIVEVSLTKKHDGKYNLHTGEFIKTMISHGGLINQAKRRFGAGKINTCVSLAEMFDDNEVQITAEDVSEELGQFHDYPNSIDTLDPSVQADFKAFFTALKAAKYTEPTITSARRSVKHQWCLHFPGKCERNGKPFTEKGIQTSAPCDSDHQYGFAIDMNVVDGDGEPLTSKSTTTRWRKVEAIAKKHNIEWQGTNDPVHFYHNTAKGAVAKLKKKCKGYFYSDKTYGSDFKSWPVDFVDDVAYITGETPASSETEEETDISSVTEEERMGESHVISEPDQVSETDISTAEGEEWGDEDVLESESSA